MGLFGGTTDPRAVHSAWVFVIFGCVHTCLGESLATALDEVKFNSLTLAALSLILQKIYWFSRSLLCPDPGRSNLV